MARFVKRKLSKKEESANRKKEGIEAVRVLNTPEVKAEVVKEKKEVEIAEVISVKDFSEAINTPVVTVISNLIKNGILANINENIDFGTAQIVGDDLGFKIVKKGQTAGPVKEIKVTTSDKKLTLRPPVVAVMGHVDHGKTSLLDKIQESNVAAGESGGITQHISAFQAQVKIGKELRAVTFIDTPGHAAFTTMRAHGTAITDIVILIVAADDGVMPQTIEVIEQAKSNNVPIVVAINKIDKPDADLNKVMQQLADQGLTPEEWGGETIVVKVSAKTGEGIDKLLESLLLLADVKEYKADPDEMATGVVIESHMHKGSGPLAIVLIENGTIRKGDPIVVGSFSGRVRILKDSFDKDIDSAGPSMPVRIAGLNGMPTFGDRLLVVAAEKEAKNQAEMHRQRENQDFVTAKRIDNEEDNSEKKVVDFNIIVKADVGGSLEAIKQSLHAISHPELNLKIVHEGIGNVSESDVNIAQASHALLLAFRVSVMGVAKRMAELEKVDIRSYDVIYDLMDEVKKQISETLPVDIVETETGKLRILATFRFEKKRTVFGGIVESGELKKNDKIRILRGEKEVWTGKIEELRSGKDITSSVSSGSECGVSVTDMVDVLKDDILVAFTTAEVKKEIK
jgi:translation initiation factor IF-2